MANVQPPQGKRLSSDDSEGQWKVDNPFGPPELPRTFSNGGIKRIRDSLSKLSPAALAEKEMLRKKNQYKLPLTQRNVDNLVTAQEWKEACHPTQRTPEIQVTEWLEHVAGSSDMNSPPRSLGTAGFN